MKAKVVVGSLLAMMIAFQVVAQRVENDDMYFNSKDREKLKGEKAEKPEVSANDKIDSDYNAFRKKHFDKNEAETEVVTDTVNPTDSYSARSINPEYISRSTAEQASEDESYYVEGYVPANTYDSYSASTNSNWNNYNNGYYGNNSYYGNNGWGSPYNPYSSACNPWMSPYYSSGMTLSLGYMWGSPGWNYGMSYGWGNYNPYSYYPAYYSPYYGANSYYGSGYGYGYPTYYYGSKDSSRPNYGKRPSRHSAIVSPTPRSSERVSSNTSTSGSNGRTRQTVDEYYVKPFRRTTTTDGYVAPATGDSGDRYVRPSSGSPASRTRESSDTRDRSSFSTPTRSSSSFSTPTRSSSSEVSTPSRSSSPAGGGSSPAPRRRN